MSLLVLSALESIRNFPLSNQQGCFPLSPCSRVRTPLQDHLVIYLTTQMGNELQGVSPGWIYLVPYYVVILLVSSVPFFWLFLENLSSTNGSNKSEFTSKSQWSTSIVLSPLYNTTQKVLKSRFKLVSLHVSLNHLTQFAYSGIKPTQQM